MSTKRTITVRFRGEDHQVTPKHAAEINRRGHFKMRIGGVCFLEDSEYIGIVKNKDIEQ